MSTPPKRPNDLSDIAKALGAERRAARDRVDTRGARVGRRLSSTMVYLGTAIVAGVVTHAVRVWAPCAFRSCGSGPITAAPTPLPEVEEGSANRGAAVRPQTNADVAEVDERQATISVRTLLATERDAGTLPEPGRAPEAGSEDVETRRAPDEADGTVRHPAPGDRRSEARPPAAPAPVVAVNLSGRWLLTNAIDETNRRKFKGLRIRFRVQLEQRGNRITGRGTKHTIDGKPLPRRQRTPIVLEGTVRGRDVVVRFVEHGTRRVSKGGFRWRISADGERLEGTFDSTAAGTRGRSHASRDG